MKNTSRRRQRRATAQMTLPKTAGWGGRRRGAGGKRKPGSGVTHTTRPRFRELPVHVTMRMRRSVYNLRSRRCFGALARCFAAARVHTDARLCHFSVQGNHLHLIVDADDKRALSRRMQGLAIRMAKALNRVMGRRGAVFADRFHSHPLRTPTEVRHAVHYVVNNRAIHRRREGHPFSTEPDVYSSAGFRELQLDLTRDPVTPPKSWLLQHAFEPERRALNASARNRRSSRAPTPVDVPVAIRLEHRIYFRERSAHPGSGS